MILSLVLADVDPWNLDIGVKGKVAIQSGYTRTADGAQVDVNEVALKGAKCKFVLVGESHTDAEHHKAQAAIIDAIAATGRQVIVGFEMFTRDNQRNIDPWTAGKYSEQEFIQESDWKKQWGFDYSLYKPIFDVIKQRGLRMAALNVPRDWVRQVGRKGPSAITADQKSWVPDLDLTNKDHRELFTAMMGGHPDMPAEQLNNIYAAQVTWDTGMAKSAFDAMAWHGDATMVICAGSGHVAYGEGIAYRLAQMGDKSRLIVVCVDSKPGEKVSKGLGDFVFTAAKIGPPP